MWDEIFNEKMIKFHEIVEIFKVWFLTFSLEFFAIA